MASRDFLQNQMKHKKRTKCLGLFFIQEVFGVTSFFLQPLVEEYAKMGFLSLAPEMFWRLKEKTELVAEDKEQFDEAMRLKGLFDFAQGIKDIEDSINYLRTHPNCNGSVGLVGFCLGGRLAFLSARDTSIDVAVGYYALNLDKYVDDIKNIKTKLMLHIAGDDHFVPKETQQLILKAFQEAHNPSIKCHVYEGADHSFARPTSTHYHKAAKELAQTRTVQFLETNLKNQS